MSLTKSDLATIGGIVSKSQQETIDVICDLGTAIGKQFEQQRKQIDEKFKKVDDRFERIEFDIREIKSKNPRHRFKINQSRREN